jgi:hypothetical protein
LTRLISAALERSDAAAADRYAERLLALARQSSAINPDAAFAVTLSDALAISAQTASSMLEGRRALSLSEEATAVARSSLERRRDLAHLESLGDVLTARIALLRWHQADAPPDAGAQRERLGAEARHVFDALRLMSPEDEQVIQTYATLLLELGDAPAAWGVIAGVQFSRTDPMTRSQYLFAAIASGHTADVLRLRDELEAAPNVDTRCVMGLALVLDGKLDQAVREFRELSRMTSATAWPPPAMTVFAAGLTGPLAPRVRTFVSAFNAALAEGKHGEGAAAAAAFAKVLEAQAKAGGLSDGGL